MVTATKKAARRRSSSRLLVPQTTTAQGKTTQEKIMPRCAAQERTAPQQTTQDCATGNYAREASSVVEERSFPVTIRTTIRIDRATDSFSLGRGLSIPCSLSPGFIS